MSSRSSEPDFKEALERILNGDKSVIEAAWEDLPSPHNIDVEDEHAMRLMLAAIALAALGPRR